MTRVQHITRSTALAAALLLSLLACTSGDDDGTSRATEGETVAEPQASSPTPSPSPSASPEPAAATDGGPPPLTVSDDGRYLADERTGTPFEWVGDTAWRLAMSLDREEVTRYLEDRADKGFSVIQVVAFDRLGARQENAYGEPPLATRGPYEAATINERYLEHLDYVLDEAERLGLVVALTPDFMRVSAEDDVYDADDARRMGEVLGERYADRPGLVWVLGGDTDPTGLEDLVLGWVEGLDAGDGGRHLMTYHATGSRGLSSRFWEDADWLDFHAIQSTHTEPCRTTWVHVTADYERKSEAAQPKPTIDIEPPYEDHPIGWEPVEGGRFVAAENRRSAYWQLLAGSAGHTYGHNSIWRFASGPPPENTGSAASMSWQEALDSPGARDMTHLRALLTTRPNRQQRARPVPDPVGAGRRGRPLRARPGRAQQGWGARLRLHASRRAGGGRPLDARERGSPGLVVRPPFGRGLRRRNGGDGAGVGNLRATVHGRPVLDRRVRAGGGHRQVRHGLVARPRRRRGRRPGAAGSTDALQRLTLPSRVDGGAAQAVSPGPAQALVQAALLLQADQPRQALEHPTELLSAQSVPTVGIVELLRASARVPLGPEALKACVDLAEIHAVGAGISAGLAGDLDLAARYRRGDDLRDRMHTVILRVHAHVESLVVHLLDRRLEHPRGTPVRCPRCERLGAMECRRKARAPHPSAWPARPGR